MPAGTTLSLKGRALRYLAAREHSRAELENKLSPYEEEPGQIQRLLDELVAHDIINEGRFVESLLHRRQDKIGSARLRHELSRKGVDRESIKTALKDLRSTELARARGVLQKRFGPARQNATPQERDRQLRFLASRGFTGEIAHQAVMSKESEASPDL